MSKQEKLGTFVGVYLVAWAIFVGLALNTPQIPAPLNDYLAIVISVVYVIFLLWMYLPDRRSKGRKNEKAWVSRTLLLNKIMFVMSLVMVLYSTYNLYQVGYLSGAYDTFSRIMYLMNVSRYEMHNVPTVVFKGIVTTSFGIAGGIFGIAFAIYIQEKVWGLRAKRRSS